MTPPDAGGARPPVGGFFGLETFKPVQGSPVFKSADVLAFWNARAALAHLLKTLGVRRLWLPAYICAEPAAAAAAAGCEIRFYGVGETLTPEVAGLSTGLRAGDAVLGVDYFGAPAPGLAALAAERRDVVWIQDRAQALWPASEAFGDHLIYSPRKVLGAPDGGLLVSRGGPLPPPTWAPDEDTSRLEPSRMRAADPLALDNGRWFAAYRAAEAAMTPEPKPISALSQAVIAAADTEALRRRRRENASRLLEAVGSAALFDPDRLLSSDAFGVPVEVEDAGIVAGRMAAAGVFCARHWAELPSPPQAFPAEHGLSRRLLTLPCDHRYGPAEMARVADAFRACR